MSERKLQTSFIMNQTLNLKKINELSHIWLQLIFVVKFTYYIDSFLSQQTQM